MPSRAVTGWSGSSCSANLSPSPSSLSAGSLLRMGYKVQLRTTATFVCFFVFVGCLCSVWVTRYSTAPLPLLSVFLFLWGVFAPYGLQGTAKHLCHFYLCLFLGGILLFVAGLGFGPCVPGRAFVRILASFYKGSEQTRCYPELVTVLNRWTHHYDHYY